MVVYKKGFEPVLEEAEAVPAVVVPVSRTAFRRKGGVAPPAPCAPSNMVKVSTVKRDRRTIEDYQNVSEEWRWEGLMQVSWHGDMRVYSCHLMFRTKKEN